MMVIHDRMQYRVKERKNMYLVYQKSQARTQGVRISGILHGGGTLLKIPMLGANEGSKLLVKKIALI